MIDTEQADTSAADAAASSGSAPCADGTLNKSEFAAHIGVTPGRVSQYIADGKIDGDALIGKGRAARVHVETALRQLRSRLDPHQMAGNGKFTRLGATSPAVTISAATAARIETAVAREFDRARYRVLRLLRAELSPDDGGGDADDGAEGVP